MPLQPQDSVDFSNQNSPIPGLPSVPLSKHFVPSYTGASPRSSVSPLSALPGNSGGAESCGSTGNKSEKQARGEAEIDSDDDAASGPVQSKRGQPGQHSKWALDAIQNRALWQRRSSLRQAGAVAGDDEASPYKVHVEQTFDEDAEGSGRNAERSPVVSVRAYRHSFGPDFPSSRRKDPEHADGDAVRRPDWENMGPDEEEESPWERPYLLQKPESVGGTPRSTVSTPYSDTTTVTHSHATGMTTPSMDPHTSGLASTDTSEPPTPGTTSAAHDVNGDITTEARSRSVTPEPREDTDQAHLEHPPSAPPMAAYSSEDAGSPPGPLADVPTMPVLTRPIHHLHSATWSPLQEPTTPGCTKR